MPSVLCGCRASPQHKAQRVIQPSGMPFRQNTAFSRITVTSLVFTRNSPYRSEKPPPPFDLDRAEGLIGSWAYKRAARPESRPPKVEIVGLKVKATVLQGRSTPPPCRVPQAALWQLHAKLPSSPPYQASRQPPLGHPTYRQLGP